MNDAGGNLRYKSSGQSSQPTMGAASTGIWPDIFSEMWGVAPSKTEMAEDSAPTTVNSSVRTREYPATAEIERAPPPGPDDELLFGRRSRLWHQEPHDRGAKQAYRRHTQKCCRPIKIRGDQAKECSAERSTNS